MEPACYNLVTLNDCQILHVQIYEETCLFMDFRNTFCSTVWKEEICMISRIQ